MRPTQAFIRTILWSLILIYTASYIYEHSYKMQLIQIDVINIHCFIYHPLSGLHMFITTIENSTWSHYKCKRKKYICHIQIFQSVKNMVTSGEGTLEAWTNKRNILHFIRQNKYIVTIGKIILVACSNDKNNIFN